MKNNIFNTKNKISSFNVEMEIEDKDILVKVLFLTDGYGIGQIQDTEYIYKHCIIKYPKLEELSLFNILEIYNHPLSNVYLKDNKSIDIKISYYDVFMKYGKIKEILE